MMDDAESADQPNELLLVQGMADKSKHPFFVHIFRLFSKFKFFLKSTMSQAFKMVNWMIVGQEMDRVAQERL